jgi:hypothetical protein
MKDRTSIATTTFDRMMLYGDLGQSADDILNKLLDIVDNERLRKNREAESKKLKMRLDWLEF